MRGIESSQSMERLRVGIGGNEGGFRLQGSDVYTVLKNIGVTHLHHANSVITSCTFLEQGGLLSRGFAEGHGLKQSAQPSDQLDKKYGTWHAIFVPHADLHERDGHVKGPNFYGPVLFVLDLDVLLRLAPEASVQVTKKSPVYWYDTQPQSERWFQNAEGLAKEIRFGDVDRIPAVQIPSGKLNFPDRRVRIILDDPRRQMSSGENAWDHAEKQLKAAAASGQFALTIERRKCRQGCICASKYADWSAPVVDFYFG